METLTKNAKTLKLQTPGSGVEFWDIKKFLKLEPYELNRIIEPRVPKVLKNLQKQYLQDHRCVAIGIVTKAFSRYSVGDMFVFNGNARSHVWKKYPELIPPEPLIVIIINVGDKEYADATYYSYDNRDAVETGADMVTGIFREWDYEPNTIKIQNGRIKSMLDLACRYGFDHTRINKNGMPLYLNTASLRDKMLFFKDGILMLDRNNKFVLHNKNCMNVNASILMIAKRYGVNHPRLKVLMENFVKEKTEINDGKEIDGVHYVLNTLYPDNIQIWKHNGWTAYKKGDVNSPVVCKILYCFDCFINNKTILKTSKRLDTNEKLILFWKKYIG